MNRLRLFRAIETKIGKPTDHLRLAGRASSAKLAALVAGTALTLALCACGERSILPAAAGMGPHPVLPPPQEAVLPTIRFARAIGWPEGTAPTASPGLEVKAYATGLDHPRWLHVLPNGDVLVAETNEPARPNHEVSFGDRIKGQVMQYVGAATRSADRITLLRGIDAGGLAQSRSTFLSGLHSPFGMALIGSSFYVADTDAVLRFPYVPGATEIKAPGVKVMDLPSAPDDHWTRDLLASRDGSHLYVSVGSSTNIAEKGIERESGRAAIHEIDLATGHSRIFASGLRNPNGLSWEPQSGALWVAVNERDDLGNDLVPDFMTSVQDGAFYGWPYCYYGQHVDVRVQPGRPDLVASAIAPDYALGSHTASLGLAFYTASALPGHYSGGAFIGQHGSWNRNPRSGYKVIFVPFQAGHPSGPAEDVLTGFLNEDDQAQGRPVGVAVDASGALLVADDVGNVVWRITSRGPHD